MITSFTVKNYKSILDQTFELGRINVFIGENGSGKTNILEAVGMAAAALSNRLEVEDLYARGIRVARPTSTFSSFLSTRRRKEIEIELEHAAPAGTTLRIRQESTSDIYSRWICDGVIKPILIPLIGVSSFTIYNLNTLSLRGIESPSKRTPLGVNGENLDVLLSTFDKSQRADLLARLKVIPWFDRLIIDPDDKLKYEGHKLGRSTSTLYFKDRFMRRGNNVFSAENANEGILHVLFYLALFMSERTPRVFGIDNIESALNPQMCRDLIKALADLAQKHEKQALITTHNPAILDGLNLHDDDQRLFVVSRNDHGHTVAERIKMKPQPPGEKYKLSELWMRGHLGGIPRRF